MGTDEHESFGGFALAHARLKSAYIRYCFSNSDPEIRDELRACLDPLTRRLSCDWEKFAEIFGNGGWLRELILTAADESKANGILGKDDAQLLDVYRQEFDSYSSTLFDEAQAFLSSGSPSLKLQRGQVQWLASLVINAVEAAFIIGATAEISESAKHLLKTKQAELARRARAAKPRETALRVAIIAERGKEPASRPAKEAAAILDGVNARLRLAGFAPVSSDVVYRRLKSVRRS
jgi:hypothetical protein